MFKQKRKEHMSAVSSIGGIDELKQRPFIHEILGNIKNILIECRQTLERVSYNHKRGKLPDTDTVKESYSKVHSTTVNLISIESFRFSRTLPSSVIFL